jgi:hypothetical protein
VHDNNTSRSGLNNSHGVFNSVAQAARIEGGLCEFACITTSPTLTPTPITTTIISVSIALACAQAGCGLDGCERHGAFLSARTAMS